MSVSDRCAVPTGPSHRPNTHHLLRASQAAGESFGGCRKLHPGTGGNRAACGAVSVRVNEFVFEPAHHAGRARHDGAPGTSGHVPGCSLRPEGPPPGAHAHPWRTPHRSGQAEGIHPGSTGHPPSPQALALGRSSAVVRPPRTGPPLWCRDGLAAEDGSGPRPASARFAAPRPRPLPGIGHCQHTASLTVERQCITRSPRQPWVAEGSVP